MAQKECLDESTESLLVLPEAPVQHELWIWVVGLQL